MMKLVALLGLAVVAMGQDTCPNYSDWRAWTDECVWFPLSNIRDSVIGACDVKVDTSGMPTLPTIPNMPEKCGHCSFKFRCRKRAQSDDCFPLDGEKEVCNEHGNVCDMPPFPLHNLGCRYEFAPFYLRQCHSRPDISDAKRDGMMKLSGLMPEFHCADHDGQCKCCCHPYMPSEDGSTCVQHELPECEPYSPWTDWSEKCMWMPPNELKNDIAEHCDFEMKSDGKGDFMKKFKLPDGIELPERCGMCSFKVKCRKRDVKSTAGKKECFPLDIEKKLCGAEDCDTCANVCEVPKIFPDCNVMEHVKKLLGPGIRSRIKKVPHSMRMGMMKMLSHMPHGKCVEKDDKCFCCCHPYEPNEDATQCVLKDICKNAEDLGIEVDLNLKSDDDAFWFL